MFRFFSRRSGDSDLEEYRKGYPNNRNNNDPRQNKNLLFYQNKFPMMPDQIFIDTFHENCFGRYTALEQGHSFIQWLFPIQEESPFNAASQQLQKHEIAAMKNDPQVLRRIFRSLELMLDFYGFDIVVAPPTTATKATTMNSSSEQEQTQQQQQQTSPVKSSKAVMMQQQQQQNNNDNSKAKQQQRKQNDDDDDDDEENEDEENEEEDPYDSFDWINLKRAKCLVTRQPDAKKWKQKFRNLLTHGHNNLRITRILKCLGEMELENLKLAVLVGLRREIFETGVLGNLADSYLSYWSGTIYNDSIREQFKNVGGNNNINGGGKAGKKKGKT